MTRMQEKYFHITTKASWETHEKAAGYQPASLGVEGFIHASVFDQVLNTASRYYMSVPDELVVLVINPESVKDDVRLEEAAPMRPELEGILFPHLYRPLFERDVENALPLRRVSGPGSAFVFP